MSEAPKCKMSLPCPRGKIRNPKITSSPILTHADQTAVTEPQQQQQHGKQTVYRQ
ncbi:hypothetical protein UVI_02005830 [Ustilaginoidea virens]|uniref:Uncharacterized protein n=1 Tax=Ustilaginoidea virens TaxID=1159556 RepID=A0A1B5KXN4_USTVR|nr:hypothetical protein UVI_02005830 [Ustilaginoidea virens]